MSHYWAPTEQKHLHYMKHCGALKPILFPTFIQCQNKIFSGKNAQILVFKHIISDLLISSDLVLSAYLCLSSLEQSRTMQRFK